MHYEIIVSLNGVHLFTTSENSLRSKDDKDKLVEIFDQKFPRSEGYKVLVNEVHTSKTPLRKID